ncbi:transcriptional regulator GcvA [Marinomonas mediterranea]|uniref:Transcriptional regulator, LysR family n=1 Tax=Marinomonas mediterranea (strain ATCC 700492 / JCM 21426 / NBRC 103028 / MMB-1) TaxID=717774 RepID=F2K0F3_MARM1|nr:transcriptional regulator GcvA [Marinomonas mediterranea]ADZ89868.1 transcriptional regulator, LysR family [Marinomonas mediterranea MMB-1]WCN16086.1 transcriptional regulator GcvA [Marinomonas mediterranea MMB-1]
MKSLPLGNLGTFAIAAKHLSFTKAAQEVHLTQGAVSQQIRLLEEKLGFELFIRHHRRLELTSAGARLAMQLDHSFTELKGLIKALKDEQNSDILTLSVMPSFATKWLIPRLGRLRDMYPDLQLRIQANDGEVNFQQDRIDVAIVHSLVNTGDCQATPLLKDDVFPVCSPAFLHNNQLESPSDLATVPLLNDDSEWRFFSPYAEWDSWLSMMKVKGVVASRGISFNRGDLAVQAAIAGQGVALGRTPLVMDDIKEGRLVCPFNEKLDAGNAYLFVCPEVNMKRESIRSLLRWLVSECYFYDPEASLTTPESVAT